MATEVTIRRMVIITGWPHKPNNQLQYHMGTTCSMNPSFITSMLNEYYPRTTSELF